MKENLPPQLPQSGGENTRRVLFDGTDTDANASPQPIEPSAEKKGRPIVKTNQSGNWTDDMWRKFHAMKIQEEAEKEAASKKIIRYEPEQMKHMDLELMHVSQATDAR